MINSDHQNDSGPKTARKFRVTVVLLPEHLEPSAIQGSALVVFDVLRATTTMVSALSQGVAEIRVFGSLEEARRAAAALRETALLCGELNAVRPEGFDLGNSPGAFDRAVHADKTLFMSTTNGTRAILAARAAKSMYVAGLVNLTATANALVQGEIEAVTLLCAGTNRSVSLEDVLGAGGLIHALQAIVSVDFANDTARIAALAFDMARDDLSRTLREGQGGQNVLRAGLPEDIAFAARLDIIDLAARIVGWPPVVRIDAGGTGSAN